MNLKTALALCAVMLTVVLPRTGSAGLVINFQEAGADVVATLSGSFAALPTPDDNFNAILGNRFLGNFPYFDSTDLAAAGSSTQVNLNGYNYISSFPAFATSGLNTSVFINPLRLAPPTTYTPGTSFTGTLTWAGQSLASLSLIDGSYVGTLANAETVTINIGSGPAPVPEPGTWAAAALLVGGAAFMRWRKRRSA
jgi:hypothetical protein